MAKLFIIFSILYGVTVCADTISVTASGQFSKELASWTVTPHNGQKAQLNRTASGQEIILLQPEKMNLGMNSGLIPLNEIREKTYQLSFDCKVRNIKKGAFACSLKFFNHNNRVIKQRFLASYKSNVTPTTWVSHKVKIGKSTAFPYPPEAVNMVIRFSFWSKENDCEGQIQLRNIKMMECSPVIDSNWPEDIVVDVGEIQVRFDKRTFWNLRRIDYKGKRLAVDSPGTYYGTVFNFPGIGFIGSGHIENQEEVITHLNIRVDGKAVSSPKKSYTCNSFELERKSVINGIQLFSKTKVMNGKIIETVEFYSKEKTALNNGYIFMHPWVTSFSDYTTLGLKNRIHGVFSGDKHRKINQAIRSSAVYNKTLNMGAVTSLVTIPKGVSWRTQYWDVDSRYRKHYCEVLKKESLQPGKTYRFKAIIVPFASSAESWQQTAIKISNNIKSNHSIKAK